MLKMIRPAMWLLERYNHPYFVVYTNTPGEIVYEDKYQIAAKTDGVLHIDELQPSQALEDAEDWLEAEQRRQAGVDKSLCCICVLLGREPFCPRPMAIGRAARIKAGCDAQDRGIMNSDASGQDGLMDMYH